MQIGGGVAASNGGGRPSGGEGADLLSGSVPHGGETARERELLHDLLKTRLALKDRTAVLALARKQLRRETKTAKARWQQLTLSCRLAAARPAVTEQVSPLSAAGAATTIARRHSFTDFHPLSLPRCRFLATAFVGCC